MSSFSMATKIVTVVKSGKIKHNRIFIEKVQATLFEPWEEISEKT